MCMQKIMIPLVCLGILLVGIVMIPSSFAESAYTMSTYVHPEEKYSIQYPSTWLVEDNNETWPIGWIIFTDSEDWTISAEVSSFGSIPFIDTQSEQERFDGNLAGERAECATSWVGYGYECRDTEPTGEHGFITLSSGEVVHSMSYTAVREYPEEHTVGITTTSFEFLCCTNHSYIVEFHIDTTNPANIPNETIFQIKQDMLESFTFLPAACDKTTDAMESVFVVAIGLFAVIGIPAIIIIVVVILIKRRKKTAQPTKQDLDDYESQYLRRQGQRPSPKPAEIRQTFALCDSCGAKFKPTSKFCAKCGSPRS